VAESLSHVSTGGGAALLYLETGTLPALEALEDAEDGEEEETGTGAEA
jgi:3-phosphoglycerate kinase